MRTGNLLIYSAAELFSISQRALPRCRPETSWMWALAFGQHEDRAPTLGYEPTREAAMAASVKSWRE
jgi:hypothetical protein